MAFTQTTFNQSNVSNSTPSSPFRATVAQSLVIQNVSDDTMWYGYSSSIGVDSVGGSFPLHPGDKLPAILLPANTDLYIIGGGSSSFTSSVRWWATS